MHFKGLSVKITKKLCIFVPEDFLILENSADPDEKLLYASFHLGRVFTVCQSALQVI